jgi:hypothetical protein
MKFEYSRKDAKILMYTHSSEDVRFWAKAFYKSTWLEKFSWQRLQAYKGLCGSVKLFLSSK